MPFVTLQNYPYVDGTTPNGGDISQDLYDPAAPASSFEIINGSLDNVNADASWPKILQRQIQEETFTSAGATAGTANLDWFAEQWFPGVELTGSQSPGIIDEKNYQAIPGANKTFYLPWDAVVICTWSVVFGGELWDNTYPASIVCVLDGTFNHDRGQARQLGRSMWRATEEQTFGHWGEIKNRHWNGHVTGNLPKGWHTIGLHLIADGTHVGDSSTLHIFPGIEDPPLPAPPIQGAHDTPLRERPVCRQVRTWVRSFKHIAFRKSG